MPKPTDESTVSENEREFINFEIEPSLKRQLQEMADRTERSLSAMVRLIVKQYLDTKGQF